MGAVGVGLGILGAAVTGWVLAPVVSMARRGTIDQRALASWCTEGTPCTEPAPDEDADPPHIPRPRAPSLLPRRWMA